jgi:hypothetical protein
MEYDNNHFIIASRAYSLQKGGSSVEQVVGAGCCTLSGAGEGEEGESVC